MQAGRIQRWSAFEPCVLFRAKSVCCPQCQASDSSRFLIKTQDPRLMPFAAAAHSPGFSMPSIPGMSRRILIYFSHWREVNSATEPRAFCQGLQVQNAKRGKSVLNGNQIRVESPKHERLHSKGVKSLLVLKSTSAFLELWTTLVGSFSTFTLDWFTGTSKHFHSMGDKPQEKLGRSSLFWVRGGGGGLSATVTTTSTKTVQNKDDNDGRLARKRRSAFSRAAWKHLSSVRSGPKKELLNFSTLSGGQTTITDVETTLAIDITPFCCHLWFKKDLTQQNENWYAFSSIISLDFHKKS